MRPFFKTLLQQSLKISLLLFAKSSIPYYLDISNYFKENLALLARSISLRNVLRLNILKGPPDKKPSNSLAHAFLYILHLNMSQSAMENRP